MIIIKAGMYLFADRETSVMTGTAETTIPVSATRIIAIATTIDAH